MIIAVIFVGTVCVIASLTAMKKSRHFIKHLLLTALQGGAALMCVNAVGVMTGVTLPLNGLTIGSAVVFGTPGIIMNLLLKIILAT